MPVAVVTGARSPLKRFQGRIEREIKVAMRPVWQPWMTNHLRRLASSRRRMNATAMNAQLANMVDTLARAGAPVVEGWPAEADPVQQAESFGFHVELFSAFSAGWTG